MVLDVTNCILKAQKMQGKGSILNTFLNFTVLRGCKHAIRRADKAMRSYVASQPDFRIATPLMRMVGRNLEASIVTICVKSRITCDTISVIYAAELKLEGGKIDHRHFNLTFDCIC